MNNLEKFDIYVVLCIGMEYRCKLWRGPLLGSILAMFNLSTLLLPKQPTSFCFVFVFVYLCVMTGEKMANYCLCTMVVHHSYPLWCSDMKYRNG